MQHIVCISSCSFIFNHMCLLFSIDQLPAYKKSGTSGKFKMAFRMATNNNDCPLNKNSISNFHSVHNTLYFNTSVLIRLSNADKEK